MILSYPKQFCCCAPPARTFPLMTANQTPCRRRSATGFVEDELGHFPPLTFQLVLMLRWELSAVSWPPLSGRMFSGRWVRLWCSSFSCHTWLMRHWILRLARQCRVDIQLHDLLEDLVQLVSHATHCNATRRCSVPHGDQFAMFCAHFDQLHWAIGGEVAIISDDSSP